MVYLEHRRRFGFREARVMLEFLSSEVWMKLRSDTRRDGMFDG